MKRDIWTGSYIIFYFSSCAYICNNYDFDQSNKSKMKNNLVILIGITGPTKEGIFICYEMIT